MRGSMDLVALRLAGWTVGASGETSYPIRDANGSDRIGMDNDFFIS